MGVRVSILKECTIRGSFSKTKQFVQFLFALWTIGDMVSDIITTLDYKDQCTPKVTTGDTISTNTSDGFNSNISDTILTNATRGFNSTNGDLISCFYWQSGVVFLILPTVISTLYNLYLVTYGIENNLPSLFKMYNSLFYGCCYPIVTPILSIRHTSRALCGGNTKGDADAYGKIVTAFKFFEVFFEALPQTIVSAVYLSNNGGFARNPIQATSIVFSGMGVIYGIIQGVIACQNKDLSSDEKVYGKFKKLPMRVGLLTECIGIV